MTYGTSDASRRAQSSSSVDAKPWTRSHRLSIRRPETANRSAMHYALPINSFSVVRNFLRPSLFVVRQAFSA